MSKYTDGQQAGVLWGWVGGSIGRGLTSSSGRHSGRSSTPPDKWLEYCNNEWPHRATATWDADLFEAVGDGEKIRKEVMKKA
jgi:hypothetical protein